MSNFIVKAFSLRNIVGCLLKKRLTKGGGVTGTPGPPSLRGPWCKMESQVSKFCSTIHGGFKAIRLSSFPDNENLFAFTRRRLFNVSPAFH